jgi:hypothetical protein
MSGKREKPADHQPFDNICDSTNKNRGRESTCSAQSQWPLSAILFRPDMNWKSTHLFFAEQKTKSPWKCLLECNNCFPFAYSSVGHLDQNLLNSSFPSFEFLRVSKPRVSNGEALTDKAIGLVGFQVRKRAHFLSFPIR